MRIFGTNRKATHYKKSRKRGRKVVILITALVLVIVGAAYAFPLITSFLIRPPDVAPFEPPREAPATEGSEEPSSERQRYTIMVAGQDAVGDLGLTDTLMLVSVDISGALTVVNIPRDTLVDMPGPNRKINAVFPLTRSIERLMEEVEKLTGFMPDRYVIVTLGAFESLVDTLGGVWFDVPLRMRYDDPAQNLHIHLDAGYQHLDGAQALQLVRFRKNNDNTGYVDGDIGRIATQQKFLRAVADELLQIRNVTRIGDLAEIFINYVETDMPLRDLIWFATQLMGMDSEEIRFITMPGEYGVLTHGGDHVVVDLEEWLEVINTYFNPFPVEVGEENVRLFTRRDGSIQLVGDGRSLTPPGARE